MNNDELIKIAKNFKIDGEPTNIEMFTNAHINNTYAITYKMKNGEIKKYILQYVNENVFKNLPELMCNFKNITQYMKEKAEKQGETIDRLTITLVDTIDNNPYGLYNNNWRMEEFVENTTTYNSTEKLEILFEAGKAIGKFQKYLDGFPTETLYETIPNFHNTPNRAEQLKEAMVNSENLTQRKNRFKLAKEAIKFSIEENRLNKTNIIINKLKNKEIPLRVTHNDTKLSNILFDIKTNESVCIIDLDTVMPGALAYDFGEGIRTSISITEEDEQDISKIKIDLDRFASYTKGFLTELRNIIADKEKETLVLRSMDDDI